MTSSRSLSADIAGSQAAGASPRSNPLEHLALAIEAATNLKTQDILLPVGVARAILNFVSVPPPQPETPQTPLADFRRFSGGPMIDAGLVRRGGEAYLKALKGC